MKRNLEDRVEVLAPVEHPAFRQELRAVLDAHFADQRSAWDMRSDGTYVQRQQSDDGIGCQQYLIERAQERHREAKRLKRRKPRAISRRNVGLQAGR